MANKDYSDNYYTDPARTHPEIKLDVPIPREWESHSYKNDVCPSFAFKGLQIFVMDKKTKELEQMDFLYSVILEEQYGVAENSLLLTDNWKEVLKFVKDFKPAPTPAEKNKLLEKNIKFVTGLTVDEFQTKCENYKIHCNHLDDLIFELAELISIDEYKK